jgi:acyl carrier protein
MVTFERVLTLIKAQLRGKQSVDSITEDTRLSDLGLSSLQFANIVFTLEDENGVEFNPERAANARTLGDLIDLANSTLAEKA